MTKQEKITASHKGIAAALTAAQMQMGNAMKDSTNPHFKNKYADLKSVREAVLPHLNQHGIAVYQPLETGEFGHVQKTVFVHADSGDTLETTIPLLMQRQDMQGLGSAITYARRYGLMSLAGIAPSEDDDGEENRRENPMGAALADAWRQSVMDSLPANATPRQTAEAFARAICEDFEGKKTKALENRWEKHRNMIAQMEDRFSDLHEMVVDAYENQVLKNEGSL